MAKLRPQRPVLLFCAIFSDRVASNDWASQTASQAWGPIALQSDDLQFSETSYYTRSMGSPLVKRLVAFESLVDPGSLPQYKQISNAWEEKFVAPDGFPGTRPINIDPGYVTEAKVVLATGKNRDHRLYLGQGVFGEVTLYFQEGHWKSSRWTYPDFLRSEYHAFFTRCRNHLRHLYHREEN